MRVTKLLGITLSIGVLASMTFHPLTTNATINNIASGTSTGLKTVQKSINLGSHQRIEDFIKSVKKQTDTRVSNGLNTQSTFYKVLGNMYKELPSKITIKTSVPESELKQWYDSYGLTQVVSKQPNLQTLANYKLKKLNKTTYQLTDDSNDKYTAKQIERGTKLFAKDVALKLKGVPQEAKITMLYDYIYNQYQYEAYGFRKMVVGNAYTGKLACNGFARLYYELALASGIPVKIIESEDHFYNHVQTSDGSWVIIDTTTDILLKQKHGATGLGQETYFNYVSKVGFYWAKPVSKETAVANSLDTWQKDVLLTAANSLPQVTYKK